MAQFDVFVNANSRTVKQFPYLLEVQSNLFEDANRAIFIPLVSEGTLEKPDKVLNAAFVIAGTSVRLFPLDMSSAPRSAMGKLMGNLQDDSDSVVAAMIFCLRDIKRTMTSYGPQSKECLVLLWTLEPARKPVQP